MYRRISSDLDPYSRIYGNMASMKTTVELPDELLVAAKKRAAEEHTTLRALVVRGLQHVLGERPNEKSGRIAWVTSPGGLPPGLDVSSRARMHDWMRAEE